MQQFNIFSRVQLNDDDFAAGDYYDCGNHDNYAAVDDNNTSIGLI